MRPNFNNKIMEDNFDYRAEANQTASQSEPRTQQSQPAQPMRGRTPKPPKPQKPEGRGRKFWRVVFGSMIGFVLGQVVLSILGIIMFFNMMVNMASNQSSSLTDNTVLDLRLNSTIVERADEDVNMFALYSTPSIALDDILKSIKAAAKEDNIKGISVNTGMMMQASPATLTEIRRALEEFKKSGKFVYAYGDYYGQGAYYLASVADSVFLNPQGTMDLRGMSSQIMFYKGLIDKLGVDVQVVKCGKFKSAVEPYLLDKMSDANREQMEVLLNSIWGEMTAQIAQSRHLSQDDINRIADSLLVRNAHDALENKLVDNLMYRSDYHKMLRAKLGVSGKQKITLLSVEEYASNLSEKSRLLSKNKIAVIYAYGQINDGKGSSNTIGDVTLCKSIRKAVDDKRVKAIVLRVNSPGGSALASEIIWNEIENAKKEGKIVVTSMGDYAASGGYYISCNSDYIVAEPTTLTGSIGVFGIIPSVGRFLDTKLGITTDGVSTNAHSDALNGMRPMDETEYAWMQNSVDQTYDTFLQRVSNGRKIDKAQVDSIGQGRVWSGKDALEIGLVDQLGNLDDAIQMAAQLADITDYKVVYPEKKSFLELVLSNESSGRERVNATVREELGELYPAYNAMKQIRDMKGVQARMPMEIVVR